MAWFNSRTCEQASPPSIPTTQGHLHKEKKNLQSTKQQPTIKIEENNNISDYFPSSSEPNGCCNEVAYVVVDRKHLSTAYQDLTGRFPYKSGQGNEYILVGYHYDANCILAQPVKNRTATALTKALQILHDKWSKAGVAPDVWVLDNKKYKTLIEGFEKTT